MHLIPGSHTSASLLHFTSSLQKSRPRYSTKNAPRVTYIYCSSCDTPKPHSATHFLLDVPQQPRPPSPKQSAYQHQGSPSAREVVANEYRRFRQGLSLSIQMLVRLYDRTGL